MSIPIQATISLTGNEDLENKLAAVADGLRVFILENPAPDKPMLGEAHARKYRVTRKEAYDNSKRGL